MGASNRNLIELLSSSALIIVGVAFSSVGRLVERVVVAHAFSPAVYGEVTIGLAVLTLGSSVSLVGMNDGIPRFLSRFDDDRDVRGVVVLGLAMSVVVSIGLSLVFFANVDLVTTYLFDGGSSQELLRMFIVAIPATAVLTVGVSALRGQENTRHKLYTKDILHPVLRVACLGVLLWSGWSIVAVGYAYLFAALATSVVVYGLVAREFSLLGPVRFHARKLLGFSAPLVLTMLIGVLLTRMDTLMLAYFRPSDQVGLYNAAYPLANSLLLVVSSFGYLYLPMTSRLDADGKREEVNELYQLTTKWGYVLTFPAFLVFVAFPGDVVSMFFGAEYAAGGTALAILAVGFFTSAALGRNRATLSALGHTQLILLADTVTIALNFVFNLVLIPRYGFVGAAVASTSAYVIRNLSLSTVLWRISGITPLSRPTVTTYVALPVALLPVGLFGSDVLTLTLLTLPAVLVVTGLLGLVVVWAAGGLQPEDVTIVDFVEQATGLSLPIVQRYIPARSE